VTNSCFALNFEFCKSSLQSVITDTNTLYQYGADFNNSVEALRKNGKNSEVLRYQLAEMMVPTVRNSAFGLATIGTFFDALDFTKFAKKNAENLYGYRMVDFYDDIAQAINYMESISPLITDASTRDDAKNVIRELRALKAKYKSCEK